MGSLSMNLSEHNYYVNMIMEGFNLIGQKAILYQVDTEERDLYYDPKVVYKEASNIFVMFESNPMPILKKYNWLTEGEDSPYIVYVSGLDSEGNPIEVQENMKIVIVSELGLKTQRVFDVSRVMANNINPLAYLCKLTPHRFHVDLEESEETYKEDEVGTRVDNETKYLKGEL